MTIRQSMCLLCFDVVIVASSVARAEEARRVCQYEAKKCVRTIIG